MATSLKVHIQIERFKSYKQRIREGRKAHHIVGDTGNDAHRVLTGSEGFGQTRTTVPTTRILTDGSRGGPEASGGVPRTMIFTSGQIAALRQEDPIIEPISIGVLDIGRILGEQNVHNLRLGDKIEVDPENMGEPPGQWIELAQKYDSGTTLSEHTIHPQFSLTHPKVWHDENGNWYYNFPGAVLLSAVMGRRLPTVKQLELAIKANPEIFQQARGYYDPSNVRIGSSEMSFLHDLESFSHFWTATHDTISGNTATSMVLKVGDTVAREREINRRLFLPVRLVIEMPDEHYLARMDPPHDES